VSTEKTELQKGAPVASAATLISEGGRYFELMLRDISSATETVELEVYIFSADELGRRVVEALTNASERGVVVRVMIDGFGSSSFVPSLAAELTQAGAEVRVFNPAPWQFWITGAEEASESLFQRLLHSISTINRRNHRKICIIDQQIAYLGSFNVSAVHLPVEQGGRGWRDTAVRLTGGAAQELEAAFNRVWKRRPGEERGPREALDRAASALVALNDSRQRRKQKYKQLLKTIKRAKRRIWITNAYFVPEEKLCRALSGAAKRGVDVRILLPYDSDVWFLPIASYMFYSRLLESGVRIFEYTASILHAKTVLIDDTGTVGSSNLNYRSIFHDLEVDVLLRDANTVSALAAQFEQDLESSVEVAASDWGRRRLLLRMLGRIILMIRYWI